MTADDSHDDPDGIPLAPIEPPAPPAPLGPASRPLVAAPSALPGVNRPLVASPSPAPPPPAPPAASWPPVEPPPPGAPSPFGPPLDGPMIPVMPPPPSPPPPRLPQLVPDPMNLKFASDESRFSHFFETIRAVARSRWVGLSLLAVIVAIAITLGLPAHGGLREWLFEQTAPARFLEDPTRGFFWGISARQQGYLGLYNSMQNQQPTDALWLDYAPLRLALMDAWAAINARKFPNVAAYQNTFAFAEPILWFSTEMELLGCIAAFLLVRHWIIRRSLPPAPPQGRTGWISFIRHPLDTPRQPRFKPDARFDAHGHEIENSWLGVWPGLIAALLLWFNPAQLIVGYAWPTGDVWVAAFFLWAVYLVCIDCWFLAGLVLAIGAMFKGQVLAVAWLFPLWKLAAPQAGRLLKLLLIAAAGLLVRLMLLDPTAPSAVAGMIAGSIAAAALIVAVLLMIFTADYQPVFRFAAGFALVTGVTVSGWMLTTDGVLNSNAVAYVAACAILLLLGVLLQRYFVGRDFARRAILPTIMAILLFIAGAITCRRAAGDSTAASGRLVVPAIFALLAGMALLLAPARLRKFVLPAGIGTVLLLCMPMFDASHAWYDCGWRFGTDHFVRLTVGAPENLPALLVHRFGFVNERDADYVLFTIPANLQFHWPAENFPVTLRAFLRVLFLSLSALCAVAAAGHLRRSDKRFLFAAVAPWMLFYALPLQIHERYLLFAAAASVCLVAVDLGSTLLHFLLSFITVTTVLQILLNPTRRVAHAWEAPNSPFVLHGDAWRNFCTNINTDLASVVLLCAAIFLVLALLPSRRSLSDPERAEIS